MLYIYIRLYTLYVYCILMRFVVAIKSVCTRRTSSTLEENRNIITLATPSSFAVWQRFLFLIKNVTTHDGSVVFREKLGINCIETYIIIYCYITPRKWFQVHKNILSWRVYDRLKYVPRSIWTFSAMFLWKTITPLNLF
jgi:hypothetical protein